MSDRSAFMQVARFCAGMLEELERIESLGGIERATKEATARRDAAKAEVEQIERKLEAAKDQLNDATRFAESQRAVADDVTARMNEEAAAIRADAVAEARRIGDKAEQSAALMLSEAQKQRDRLVAETKERQEVLDGINATISEHRARMSEAMKGFDR